MDYADPKRRMPQYIEADCDSEASNGQRLSVVVFGLCCAGEVLPTAGFYDTDKENPVWVPLDTVVEIKNDVYQRTAGNIIADPWPSQYKYDDRCLVGKDGKIHTIHEFLDQEARFFKSMKSYKAAIRRIAIEHNGPYR